MDHLVDYARSGKGQDWQSRASQAQARSTGVSGASCFSWAQADTSGLADTWEPNHIARTLDERSVRWAVIFDKALSILLEGLGTRPCDILPYERIRPCARSQQRSRRGNRQRSLHERSQRSL